MFGFFKKKSINPNKYKGFTKLMYSIDDFKKDSDEIISLKRMDFLDWQLKNGKFYQ